MLSCRYKYLLISILGVLLVSCNSTIRTTQTVTPSSEIYSAKPLPAKPLSLIPIPLHANHKRNFVALKEPEKYSPLQLDYARQLEVLPAMIKDTTLYGFIDNWMGTRYKYGGVTDKGIDCSGFTCTLYKNVFDKEIAGSSGMLFNTVHPVEKDELTEGDMVFFKIKKNRISHVGVYLMNNKFVHSSSHNGVIISDLNEEYYKKHFYTGGRLMDNSQ